MPSPTIHRQRRPTMLRRHCRQRWHCGPLRALSVTMAAEMLAATALAVRAAARTAVRAAVGMLRAAAVVRPRSESHRRRPPDRGRTRLPPGLPSHALAAQCGALAASRCHRRAASSSSSRASCAAGARALFAGRAPPSGGTSSSPSSSCELLRPTPRPRSCGRNAPAANRACA